MSPNVIEEVKRQASYRWKEIFLALAPQLQPAIEKAGRHVPCPVHGGVDGFRLFPHYEARGDGICNTCGHFPDGFALLMWVNNWNFPQTVREVGRVLGVRNLGGARIERPDKEEEYTGCIKVLHDAPYLNNPKNAQSFTVTLQLENQKTVTLWGMDLKTALEGIRAQAGDWVNVKRIGKRAIKFDDKSFNKTIWSAHKADSPEQREAKAQAEKAQHDRAAEQKRGAILKIWKDSLPLSTNHAAILAARRYLMRRFILPANGKGLESFAVHPGLFYADGEKVLGTYPALICRVTDCEGNLVTLHRTYLSFNGFKAKVPSPKKLMSVPDGMSINGAAIRLTSVKPELGIAEGLETALSVMRLTGMACWSVISANGMRTFQVPAGVKKVHIYADKDTSGEGERAANELHDRLTKEGIKAEVHLPPQGIPKGGKGVDFNDVLVKKFTP